jgi:hypothetical protein
MPGADQLDQLRDGETVRQHHRFGASLVWAAREQFERAAAVGAGRAALAGDDGADWQALKRTAIASTSIHRPFF